MATPYMNLTLPTASISTGPGWASTLNDAITSVDSHDHTSGKGIKVPTAGININADLALNSFNMTNIRSLRLVNQGSPLALGTDLGCIYESGGNLYYNNSGGSQVQITAGAALNGASLGAIGGDYSTSTASLFYTSASKIFTFWQSSNTPAKIDTGDLILRNITTPTNAITVLVPGSLAASYSLTLPGALPGSVLPLTCNASGVIAFSSTVSAIDVTGNATFGGSLTLTGALVANGAVTLGDSSGDVITINGTVQSITVSGASIFNGAVTLGDAAADIITITGEARGVRNTFSGSALNFNPSISPVQYTLNGTLGVGTTTYPYVMTRPGSIVGYGVTFRMTAFSSVGTCRMKIQKNGVDFITGSNISFSATGLKDDRATFSRNANTFIAGDYLSMVEDNNGSSIAGTLYSHAWFEVIFDT
jgi:hypothetical protein